MDKRETAWYKITLTVGDLVNQKHIRIQERFTEAYLLSGWPPDAGVFRGREGMDNVLYFSPSAARIAQPLVMSCSGVECEAPHASEVSKVVGNLFSTAIPFAPEP